MSRRLSPPNNAADVIGTAPVRDELAGLPMFIETVTPAEAEAEIRRDFLEAPAEPAPEPARAEREPEQTQAFDGTARTEQERQDGIARIQAECLAPLLALAEARKDRAEHPGVTAKDVRAIADARGLSSLIGSQQRAWSWLPTWLGRICTQGHLTKYRIAGMVVRRMGDNGNEHVVYLHPYDFRARAAA